MIRTLPLITTIVAGSLALSSMAQCPGGTVVTVFSSDFETSNGGFVESGGGDWEYGTIPVTITGANCESATINSPGGAHSGTKGWGTLLDDCYQNLGAFSGVGFTVNLSDPNFTSAKMEFAHWFNVFTNFDYLRITVNGTQVYKNDTTELSTGWLMQTVDLTPYLGQANVSIVFDLWATTVVNRTGWYLDDVVVTACSSIIDGIAESGNAGFRAWPIPASDVLQVEPSSAMGMVKAWTLYDATGRVMAQGVPVGNDRFSIDVSAFKGLGVLELRTANGAHRQQVVMQ